jgi:hypothetical protein
VTLHDAGNQALAGDAADRGEVVEVGRGGAGAIQRKSLDGTARKYRKCLTQAVEVGGDQNLGPGQLSGQHFIGG